MTDEELKSSSGQELHAFTAHAMVGLLGPRGQCEEFIQEWVHLTSQLALSLLEAGYPDIQLIPLQEMDEDIQEPT